MTYKKNFVVAIKVNGKILRENGEEVQLPFGSEYSILLKNLNAVRAMAQISIDGKEAGPYYILGPNASVEIERFNISGNQKQGNRFKFIERTEAIESYRGIQVEDGLIRVEFKKEKISEPPQIVEHHTYHQHYPYYPRPYVKPFWPYYEPSITWCGLNNLTAGRSVRASSENSVQTTNFVGAMQANLMKSAEPMNEAGITVQGEISNQEFVNATGFQTETSEVLTIKLIGKHGNIEVDKPITVDLRVVCQTCGKRAKGNAKFCSQCGTSLVII